MTFHLLETIGFAVRKTGRAMRQGGQSLDHSILAAFRHAQDTGRFDVAEHLLCALECFGRDDAVDRSAAGEAYQLIYGGYGARTEGRQKNAKVKRTNK